jgi:hypothetical protein
LALLQAAITAGLYPNVASRVAGEVNFTTVSKRKAKIHLSSVNASAGQPLGLKCKIPQGEIELLVYGELVRGSSSFTMSQTTSMSTPLPLLLLCGNLRLQPISVDIEKDSVSLLILDESLSFTTSPSVASSLVILRKRLNHAFSILVSCPANGLNNISEREKSAVDTFVAMLKAFTTKL